MPKACVPLAKAPQVPQGQCCIVTAPPLKLIVTHRKDTKASAIRPGEVDRNANAFDICRRMLDCNSRNITDHVSAVPTAVTEIPSATSTTETEPPDENHSTVRQTPGLTPTIFERGPRIARMLRGTRQMASAFQVRQTPEFGRLWGKFHDGGKIIY